MSFRKLKDLPSGIVKANPAENSGEVVDINFGGLTAPGMATPVLGTDGANKSYVDSITEDVVKADNALSSSRLMVGVDNRKCRVEPQIIVEHITEYPITSIAYEAEGIVRVYSVNASEVGHDTLIKLHGMSVSHYNGEYLITIGDAQSFMIVQTFTTTSTGAWSKVDSAVNVKAYSFNSVRLDATGSTNDYLNSSGTYTVPSGSGNVNTAVTLTNQYMIIGAGTDNVKTAISIYADATGAKLYVGAINDIVLTTGGSATQFLNAAGAYTTPAGSGNVSTAVTLTANHMVVGADTEDVKITSGITVNSAGTEIYANSFNAVELTVLGNAHHFLNASGTYTVPIGSGNVNTAVTLTANYLVVGAGTDNVKTAGSIYADATGAKLYVGAINDIVLTTGGSATAYLNAAGAYTVPPVGGNVNTAVTLTANHMVVGADTEDVKITSGITVNSAGTEIYANSFNAVELTVLGNAHHFLNASGTYTVPIGSGNVNTAVTLTANYLVVGAGTDNVKTAGSIYADATGAKLYVGAINDIILTTGGSATAYLNAAGAYTVPPVGGNVSTAVTLTANHMVVGADTEDVKITSGITVNSAGTEIYANSFNAVELTVLGNAHHFLNASGTYTIPIGSGNVNTAVTLTNQYMIIGAGTDNVKTAGSIYADATGAKLYVGAINDIILTTGGSATAYLNAAGAYTVPPGGGNVNTAVTLTNQYMIIGAGTDNVKTAISIYADATGAKLYVGAINDIVLTTGGSATAYLNAAGTYTVPPNDGNVSTTAPLTDKYLIMGASTTHIASISGLYTDPTGTKLYAPYVNDVVLTAAGSPTQFLNAAGTYTTPIGGGNVSTAVTLTDNYLIIGAGTNDVKKSSTAYMSGDAQTLHADNIAFHELTDSSGNTTRTAGVPTLLSGTLDSLNHQKTETLPPSSSLTSLDIAFNTQTYKQIFSLNKITSVLYLYRYNLPKAKDIKDMVQDQTHQLSFNDSESVSFNQDGTKIFFTSLGGSTGSAPSILAWELPNAWSILLMTNLSELVLSTITNEMATPSSFVFSSNGYKCYVLNNTTGVIVQMKATTPFSLVGVTYDAEVNFGSYGSLFHSISFKEDGRACYLTTNAAIQQFILATPWDLTSYSVHRSLPASAYKSFLLPGDAHTAYGMYTSSGSHIAQFLSELSADSATFNYLRLGRQTFVSSTGTNNLGVASIYGWQSTPSASTTLDIQSNVVSRGTVNRPFFFTVVDEVNAGHTHILSVISSYPMHARYTTISHGRASLAFYTDGYSIYGITPDGA